MQSSDYCMLEGIFAVSKTITYFITRGVFLVWIILAWQEEERIRQSFLKISERFWKILETCCVCISHFLHYSATWQRALKKGKKIEKVCLLATDIKQIMNNQSKVITSNPEAENNSVQQLRWTVTSKESSHRHSTKPAKMAQWHTQVILKGLWPARAFRAPSSPRLTSNKSLENIGVCEWK